MPSGSRESLEKVSGEYKAASAGANFRLMERPEGWSAAKIYDGWLAR